MRKKILSVIIIAIVAIVDGWNYQQGKTDVKLSDLALANVEVLASEEAGGVCQWRTGYSSATGWIAICDSYGVGYDCPCGSTKYY